MNGFNRSIGALALAALPWLAGAQTNLNLDQVAADAATARIGGTPAVDMITIRAVAPGIPLRYPNIIAGSERIMLNGAALRSGDDYAMDYESGVVYLKVPQSAGQSLTASYRYSATPDPKAPARAKAFSGFKYNLVPGGLSLLTGIGFTERTADGQVLTGNAFGFNNSMKFGGGSLNGMYIYSSRSKSDNAAGLNFDTGAAPGSAGAETGASQAIVQNYSSSVMGGKVSLDYQDVGQNFAAFSSMRDAGADDATVNRYKAERGLTRLGVNAQDLKVGNMAFSTGVKSIGSASGNIDWRSFGAKVGGLSLSYSSQRVDSGFARFNDLAESDKAILQREVGLARESMAANFDSAMGKLSFSTKSITDTVGNSGLRNEEVGFDSKQFKFNYGRQTVDTTFGRAGSLFDDERAKYGLDAGLSRQWMALNSGVMGKGTSLTFADSVLSSANGSYHAQDIGFKASSWSISHSSRVADSGFAGYNGFNRVDSATNRVEADLNTSAIAAMYGPGVASNPNDRTMFNLGAGISRDYTNFSAQPFKGWDLSLSNLTLTGANDGGNVQMATLKTGNLQASFRKQQLGDRFDEFARMMDFERANLGNIAGLDRTEFGLSMNLGKGRSLAFNSADASVTDGGFSRQTASYKDKRLEVSVNSREVASGFASLGNSNDPERDLLNALRGYKQTDGKVKWQLLPNFKIEANWYDAANSGMDITSRIRNLALDWSPDKRTNLSFYQQGVDTNDPATTLFSGDTSRLSLTRDLGQYGKVAFLDERIDYLGKNSQVSDSHRMYAAYQTKLNPNSDLKTEQTKTVYANGSEETVSSNSVATKVSKGMGLSLTDTSVDRQGKDNDQRSRNIGLWFDIGHGLRFSYGYARQLLGESNGTASSTMALGSATDNLTPDQVGRVQPVNVGGLMMGAAQGVNTWDADGRTQGFTNMNLSVAKPFAVGPLKDVKMSFGMDSASDRAVYLKDNQLAQFSAGLLGTKLAYEYKAQTDATGAHGIDRAFRFDTDPNQRRFLSGSVYYKVRTLPTDDSVMIRNYNITLRPSNDLELVNKLETNPEQQRNDLILGSLPIATRSNKWELNYRNNPNLAFGANWTELINDATNAVSRTAGLNLTLFGKSGSPVTLFYGMEQTGGSLVTHRTSRYSLRFDQRPGPNQALSFFIGNISYEGTLADGEFEDNLSLRLNYQLRF